MPLPGPGRPFMRSISDLLFEPAFTGLFGALAGECFRPPRPPELLDESVGSFISRRFSPHMADNLVSAFVHGVYAGDLYKLSMRSLAPFFWRQEAKHGSIVKGLLDTSATSMNVSRRDYNVLKHVREDGGFPFSAYRHASQLSFRHGIGWLTQNLERKLKSDDNCVVRTGSKVTSIQYDESTQAINVSPPLFPFLRGTVRLCQAAADDILGGKQQSEESVSSCHLYSSWKGLLEHGESKHPAVGGNTVRQRHGREPPLP